MRPRPARSTPSTSGSDMARKGILLLSGGFDSPVAGRLMSRQGLGLVAAHFSLEPITDDAAAVKGPEICDLLGPPRPSTHARLDQILGEEAKLDLDRLVASSLRGVVAERFKADGPARRVPTGMRTAA